jgi:opacity protein-like surface antigen
MRFVSLGLGVAFGLMTAGTVFAADLMVSAPPVAVVPDSEWHPYVKAYGGYVPSQDLTFVGDDDHMDAGWLLGGAIGVQVMDGIAVELDGTYSTAAFEGSDFEGIHAATAMVNVVLTGPLSDQIAVYGGVGLGGIGTQYYSNPDSEWGYGLGGQVFAGVSFAATENVSIFGEARYQAAFDTITMDHNVPNNVHTDDVDFARYSLLAGVKLGF